MSLGVENADVCYHNYACQDCVLLFLSLGEISSSCHWKKSHEGELFDTAWLKDPAPFDQIIGHSNVVQVQLCIFLLTTNFY